MTRAARWTLACALALGLGFAVAGNAAAHYGEEEAHSAETRESPVEPGGCYALRSLGNGRFVTRGPGRRYAATSRDQGNAEVFRAQATGIERFLLIDSTGAVVAADDGSVVAARQTEGAADWKLSGDRDGTLRVVSPLRRAAVTVTSDGGRLAVGSDARTDSTRFRVEDAEGCTDLGEVALNVRGAPSKGDSPDGEVRGLLDTHLHLMAFEFLGGMVHCGRPWHPDGPAAALVDCPDHEIAGGAGAVLENLLSTGLPVGFHDPVGWPTFRDWPRHDSLTHEGTYYRWVERSWRAGLRIMVNLLVDNEALCMVYPFKRNKCDDMESVRLQAQRTRELEAFIDEKHGGPGKGWFRVVTDPFEARRVINDGKLAVIMGIEVSRLFGCGVRNDVPECSRDDIDRQLDEVWDLGVRDMELVNKFDNALSGVAFDEGPVGGVINAANWLMTGQFWQAETCAGSDADRELTPGIPDGRDRLLGMGLLQFGLLSLVPKGLLPVYPPAPHCNVRGLSELGEHLIRRMIEKGMIIDTDHMSVLGRSQALSIIEAEGYSGIVSSHSWSDDTADERILRLGGVIGPYAGSSTSFAEKWRKVREIRDPRYFFGIGFGPDTNGFGAQGGPRPDATDNPVEYPFRSFDGKQVIDRQVSGERVFDINTDGVAHYGLYPDWVEDLRKIAGEEIVEDLARGPEAYLQMWERAVGVRAATCRSRRGTMRRTGFGNVRLGRDAEGLLRSAGQPRRRSGLTWRWCVRGGGRVAAVMSATGRSELVLSTARGHRAGGVRPGASARRIARRTRSIGGNVRIGPRLRDGSRLVYGVRRGRVRFVAAADRRIASRPSRVRAAVRRGLR